jgi:hypothetical protein
LFLTLIPTPILIYYSYSKKPLEKTTGKNHGKKPQEKNHRKKPQEKTTGKNVAINHWKMSI